jgi:signal transduction histidine kinase
LLKITQLLDECANLIEVNANKQELNFKKDYPDDLPAIQGDYDKLKQAIINLLSNSVKYNFPGGDVILRAFTKHSSVIIQVEDTGIGIPKEHLASLFQKFFRVPGSDTVSSGTGLGLTVVKRIVEGHHGDISVHSDQGKGATFSIAIPIATNLQTF